MPSLLKRYRIKNGDQIPEQWGPPRLARRKTSVTMRIPEAVETFTKSWGTLTAYPGQDVIVKENSGQEYPVQRDIFSATYEKTPSGEFRKTKTIRLVQVPENSIATLLRRDGEMEVRHPDYVVIGTTNEVYAMSASRVEKNLEFFT